MEQQQVPDKDVLSQLSLLRFGIFHGSLLDTVITLWHDFVQETKTTERIAQYDWWPHRILVCFCLEFYMMFDFSFDLGLC